MQLIYDTIINRSTDSRSIWPSTPTGVVLQPYQFSGFVENGLQAPKLVKVGDWLTWTEAKRIAETGKSVDKRVNHFHHNSVKPKWAVGKVPVKVHRNHTFYSF